MMLLRFRMFGFVSFALFTLLIGQTTLAAENTEPQSQLQSRHLSHEQTDKTLFTTFIKYAEFAAAAYADIDGMKQTCLSYGYEFSDSGANLEERVRYFIATDTKNKTQIIAVRGTANMENSLIDMNYGLTADTFLGIELHKGFGQSAQNIYQTIKNKIHKDYAIQVTGHSLGGAVAVILAMYLDKSGYKVSEVTTFGQPKITNRFGTKIFHQLNVVRINTLEDMIPTLPPFDASQIMNLKVGVFWPLGKEYVLLSDNHFSILEGLESLLRGILFLNKKPGEENITAHKMDTYLLRLKNLQNKGKEIPFEQRDQYLQPKNQSSV